jgi:hypothetical protein
MKYQPVNEVCADKTDEPFHAIPSGQEGCKKNEHEIELNLDRKCPVKRLYADCDIIIKDIEKRQMKEKTISKEFIPAEKQNHRKKGSIVCGDNPQCPVSEIAEIAGFPFSAISPFYLIVKDKSAYHKEKVNT